MLNEMISIIVPVYNQSLYLSRCLDSILNQTFKKFELILVDDGSTDGSSALCDSYAELDTRIKVIHKVNGGLSSARNAGLDIANGDYVGFVDSDDWIDSLMYNHLYQVLRTNECDIASIRCVLAHEKKDIRQPKKRLKIYHKREILQDYLYEGTRSVCGSYSVCRYLYRRKLFDNIRFPIGKVNEDIVTNYLLLSKAEKMVKSNYIAYFYYQNKGSITTTGLKERDFDLLSVCNELYGLALKESYGNIAYLAKVKNVRSYFSLLAKIAFYGIEDATINKTKIVKELTQLLRDNMLFLLQSPIPLDRKIMVLLLCVNIKCLEIPLRIYKMINSLK